MTGWVALVRERFPLPSYLPMVALFAAGNGAVAIRTTGADAEPWRVAVAFAIALSFFFRLRCFDEIKDYATDLGINPTRPLPRGALSVPQVFRGALWLSALELAATTALGGAALVAHAIAIAYSFLMYREFFIGDVLRPHLTTYAVTHTFVSVLLGYSVMAQISGAGLIDLPPGALAFGAVNWGLFNLFEFARKTYAPEEERPHVASYSRLFRPIGAGLLSLSQVAIALGALWWLSPGLFAPSAVRWHAGAAGLLAVCAVIYVVRSARPAAALLRAAAGVYLVGFWALVNLQLW